MVDDNELSRALRTIFKGSALLFVSSLFTVFLTFGSVVIIARNITKAEYGIYSLAIAIYGFVTVVAIFGLRDGIPRCIAYVREKGNYEKVKDLVANSILILLFFGVILFLLIFIFSGFIAFIFHDLRLSLPLKILSFSIPLYLLTLTFDSIFRGFDNVKPGVYFSKILSRFTQFVLISLVVLLGFPFIYIFYAILLATAIVAFVFSIYFFRNLVRQLKLSFKFSLPVALELLSFSVPLFGASILIQIMGWTDTFMLGFFKTSIDVGLYNAANPIARFILAPALMLNSIYIPVVSGMYSKGLNSDIKRTYSLTTKWLCFLTYPLFLLLLLEPGKVLGYTFGWKYTPASNVLRMLALGFMVGNILGPNYATLVALGESRFIMLATAFATILNVGLNIALIPTLGIVGAAIATSTSEIGVSVLRWLKVFSSNGSIPVSKNLIKPLAVLTPAFLLLLHVGLKIWFVFPLSYLCLALAIFLTKSLEAEDWEIINAVMEKVKVKS